MKIGMLGLDEVPAYMRLLIFERSWLLILVTGVKIILEKKVSLLIVFGVEKTESLNLTAIFGVFFSPDYEDNEYLVQMTLKNRMKYPMCSE